MENRIAALREARGLSQRKLAELVGTTGQQIGHLESGRRQLTTHWMERLAAALECRPTDLIEDATGLGVDQTDGGGAEFTPTDLRRVMVRGEVQAGAWVEAYEFPEAEWFPVTVPESKYDHLPQFALKVRGPSMDLLYPEGSVVICVPFAALRRQPKNGERVVVERHRDGLVEATIKEIEINGNGTVRLWPRSSSPRFKDAIELPASHLPWGLAEGPVSLYQAAPDLTVEPEAEIHVTALVIGSFRWEG